MPRISVVEQYDNKDLIQQIYRLKDLVETGTASNIAVTDNHDGTITVDVTMRDGSIQTFTLTNDNIATIAAVQSGGDVTVTVTFESGSTQSFTFNVASGKVDVLTTAGSYVYTHTGATQNEQPYSINAVAGSIMQRDVSGQTEVKSPAADTDSDYVVNMAKLNARLTDGSVTKVGTSNVGSDTKPIKLVAGVPTVITNDLVDLPSTQAITGVKTVPLETTGVYSDQIASSNKVKNELDNYAPMLRTTGNQVVSGIKALWNPYYNGSLATTGGTNYTDLGKMFGTGSFGNICLSLVGREDYCLGVITASHDAGLGTLTVAFDGVKSTSGKLGLYIAMLADGGHLLAKRKTAAGQGFTIQILGIGNVTTAPPILPQLTYSEINITTELIEEVIEI